MNVLSLELHGFVTVGRVHCTPSLPGVRQYRSPVEGRQGGASRGIRVSTR